MKTNRPNILVIQAAQLTEKYLGAYGFELASTPHIDLLAASGAYDNDAEFASSTPTFAHYLCNLDYRFAEE